MTRLSFMKTWNSCRNGKILKVKKKTINLLPLLFLIVLIIAASPSMGQDQKNSIKWDELRSGEKQILAPLQDKWDKLSPAKQNRLKNSAMKWNAMSPEQQKNLQAKTPNLETKNY